MRCNYTTQMDSYQNKTNDELIKIINDRDTTIEEQKCYCIGYNEAMNINVALIHQMDSLRNCLKDTRDTIMREYVMELEGECPEKLSCDGEIITTILPTGEKIKSMA